MKDARFNLVMAGLLAGIVVAYLALARAAQVSGGFSNVGGLLYDVALLTLVCAYTHYRELWKFYHVSQMLVWTMLAVVATVVLPQLAGRSPAPLVDAGLARLDGGLGFSTGAVVAAMSHFPVVRRVFSIAYGSLIPLILASLFVPIFFGRERDSQRYILSLTIAAIITALLFAMWPAIGPWVVYGFAPDPDQKMVQSYLLLLKSSAPVQFNSKGSCGVVSFPSFHVILAICSAIALWNIPRIRYVVLAVATAICISTLTTGWHYLVDIVGAVPVILVSHAIAARVCRPVAVSAPATESSALPAPALMSAPE